VKASAIGAQAALAALIALVVALLAGLLSVPIVVGVGGSAPLAIAVTVVLAAASGLSLNWPRFALGIAWAGAILQMAAGLPVLPADLAILPVLFATGAHADRRLRLAGIVSAILGAVLAGAYLSLPLGVAGLQPSIGVGLLFGFATLVTLVLSWTFGALVALIRRSRGERAAAEAERLEAIAEQERGRIARDMHDVVAHSLAVIVAQADGARYLAADDPARAGEALGTISGIAREALGDVRALLARLRHRQGDFPQPGLADVEALLEQFRGAGLPLEAELGPRPDGVASGVQLAVYRILQESLTNALRHGDRSRPVRARLGWDGDRVRLEVRSALGTSGIGEPGHGVTGMRERARLVDGALTAGPEAGDFVVAASLPLRAEDSR